MSAGHDHSHPSTTNGRRLACALTITALVFVAEVVGAVMTGSLALLIDAGHMLTDLAGLAMALVAARLVARPATLRRTWGFHRAEVISAAAQAILLLGVGVYVLIEGLRRLVEPPEISSGPMVIFGIVGLVGNIASLAILAGARDANLNMRAAFLEVLNDAIGSISVIVAAVVITATGWTRADAIVSLVIALLIVPRTLRLLKDALRILLEFTPRDLDLAEVRRHILELDHVQSVHDLHASQIATGLPVVTAHVVLDDECFFDGHSPRVLDQLQQCVAEHFPINVQHSTFQLEMASHAAHEAQHH